MRQQILAWKYKPSGKRIRDSRICLKEAFVGSKDKKPENRQKTCITEGGPYARGSSLFLSASQAESTFMISGAVLCYKFTSS
jgi:hypothetical protein